MLLKAQQPHLFVGNVVFQDADSARRAILGLGTVMPSQDDPDGFGKPCTVNIIFELGFLLAPHLLLHVGAACSWPSIFATALDAGSSARSCRSAACFNNHQVAIHFSF